MEKNQKKKLKPDDPKQSAQFIGLAKKNKVDNDEELFEEALKKIIKANPQKQKKK